MSSGSGLLAQPSTPLKCHPCFGFPLNKATKLIAQINIIFSMAYFILILGMAILFVIIFDEVKDHVIRMDKASVGYAILVNGSGVLVICLLVAFMAICIGSIYLNVMLYGSVRQKNCCKVRVWLSLALPHLFLLLIFNVCMSAVIPKSGVVAAYETLQFVYLGYSLWVVHDFHKEIKPLNTPQNNYDCDDRFYRV